MNQNYTEVVKGNNDTLTKNFEKKRHRAYCFTSFEEVPPNFNLCVKFKYLCYSPEECPTTKKKHWQGYFCLSDGMTISAIQKLGYNFGFLCPAIGTAEQNRIYCGYDKYEKDGKIKEKNLKFCEFGSIPQQGKRTDLKEINEKIKSGVSVKSIRQDDPMLYHQYGRTLEKLEDDYIRSQYRKDMPEVIWYYGKTGVGKSHTVFQNYNRDTEYLLNVKDNGFWEDYMGQKTVIINEFRGEIPFADLLQICDKWDYLVKRKGRGTIPLLATKIVITSCKRPEDIYSKSLDDDDNIEQFLRRCKIIELKPSSSRPLPLNDTL